MDDFFLAKIKDLDRIAYERGIEKHSGFLSEAEIAAFHRAEKELSGRYFLTGGYPDAERMAVIWPADYEEDGDAERSVIACLKAAPVSPKFSEELSHRDFLGAMMNLSIERECIGDICCTKDSGTAWIFCQKNIAPVLCDELTRVRHTEVTVTEVPLSEVSYHPSFQELNVNVASERLDALLAAVYKLSRKDAAELIQSEKVFVNGEAVQNDSKKIPEGAKISVRGFGKFLYDGISAESRKGRLFVKIRKYI